MEDKKRLSFSYEDTDKSIEIELYGLVFEIRNLDNIERLKTVDRNNKSAIENQLEQILGEGAIDEINRKRKNDGYKELDLNIELNILGCIFESYAKSMSGNFFGKITNTIEDINGDIDNFKNMNREQIRNYNKFRNNRRNNQRNFRRY